MTISLVDEFYAAINMGGAPGVEWALRHGVDQRTIFLPKPHGQFHGYPAFGVDCIEVFNDGTYQPAADGRVVFIMPANRWGELGQDIDDLVAWEPKTPARWWTRLGLATVMNETAIDKARFDSIPPDHLTKAEKEAYRGPPLVLAPTPWHWLRSGFEGAVILDRNMDTRALLSGLSVVAASFDHGRALKSHFDRHPLPVPKIIHRRTAA